MTQAVHPELHRPFVTLRLGREPVVATVTASAEECAAIALRLGIVAVLTLDCSFTLRRPEDQPDDRQRGMIIAEGELRAGVVQDCVVTLEPFEAGVLDRFRVRFVHAGMETDDLDPEADDEIPYKDERVDLGDVAVEQLALVLDPYPRKPGAELPADIAGGVTSHFAVLARRPPDG